LRNLPGYPARLHRDAAGNFHLGIFGLRTHLIEFVLKEDDFRQEMLTTVPPEHWIAPALSSGGDCLEPMQIGSVKALGSSETVGTTALIRFVHSSRCER
jgi:hypothetical protein